ncbi:MAG: ABC-2 transporter permease [Lachnospiraceae bacterium]|nr:ABC-2 transporter permease [Lachnospiraceae bacterium]
MRGLLYKEFYQFKSDMYLVFAFLLLLIFPCVGSTGDPELISMVLSLCYMIALLLGGMLSSEFFSKDEKRSWSNFVFSLPQTEKGQVTAKYYAVLLFHLLVLFVCFVIDTIVVAIYGSVTVSGIMAAVIVFAWRILVCAIKIPFMLRFGSMMGNVVEAACFGMILMLLGVYALFGDISFFLQDNIRDALVAFVTSGNVIWILALLPYVAGVAYYLSYRVSLKAYREGAESYGQ